MNRTSFASLLSKAISEAWVEFLHRHPEESPYAFALIGDPGAASLGFAVATEEGLRQIAAKYDEKGYRYQGWDWEEFDNREKLSTWLRWANPDDGWRYSDFPEQSQVESSLALLVANGALGEGAEDFEEFCVDVLTSIRATPAGDRWPDHVVFGFTHGEDPRDFLRTATRANPYPLVRKLWSEHWQAEELSSRIVSPSRT